MRNLIHYKIYSDEEYNIPYLMTPARFVPRPRGYEVLRALSWWLLKRPDLAGEIESWILNRDQSLYPTWTMKHRLIGAMFDISHGTPCEWENPNDCKVLINRLYNHLQL